MQNFPVERNFEIDHYYRRLKAKLPQIAETINMKRPRCLSSTKTIDNINDQSYCQQGSNKIASGFRCLQRTNIINKLLSSLMGIKRVCKTWGSSHQGDCYSSREVITLVDNTIAASASCENFKPIEQEVEMPCKKNISSRPRKQHPVAMRVAES